MKAVSATMCLPRLDSGEGRQHRAHHTCTRGCPDTSGRVLKVLHSADQYQFTFLFLDLHVLFVHLSHNCAASDSYHVAVLAFSLQPPTLLFQFSNLQLDITITPGLPAFTVWLDHKRQRADMDRVGFILLDFEHLATFDNSRSAI